MDLYESLLEGAELQREVRVGVIGAGKFGTMFLAQARVTPGVHVVGIADLSSERAERAVASAGWKKTDVSAGSFEDALSSGTTFITESSEDLISCDGLDVIVEVTGNPAAGIRHALQCFENRKHLVMVNVEADALVGPLLAQRAREAGVVYSLAYGDQPALICELVDRVRTAGFEVVCAGKGTKYLPEYHASTPETVWDYYGFTKEQLDSGDFNPQMFNSFLDGTKSAIEMAAVSNATGLTPPSGGLGFPAAGVDDLTKVCRPVSEGGTLERSGTVEVVSSLERDGSEVERDLRWGVYVTFEAPTDYAARCFAEYGLTEDPSDRYASLYRPFHLIGLELGVSVSYAALRNRATGTATGFRGDVVATAKRDLRAGERLDGEGGYTVYGRLASAEDSVSAGALPMGLAQGVTLRSNVARGEVVSYADVEVDETQEAYKLRREMESRFAGLTATVKGTSR